MKFGVVIFPGSNCDQDMIQALSHDLNQKVVPLWHKDNDLDGFDTNDCIVLPGGFSYGDYLRCGALARFSPIMEQVINFAEQGGKVLGVCNGFQILCEAGLLPGALLQNENQKFVCKNVYVKSDNNANLIGFNVRDHVLKIPVAHGEGRFHADQATMQDMINNQQVILRYCNKNGEIHIDSNPNGAIDNIAGICNRAKNVFGMMPHPERACSSALKNEDGKIILSALTLLN